MSQSILRKDKKIGCYIQIPFDTNIIYIVVQLMTNKS